MSFCVELTKSVVRSIATDARATSHEISYSLVDGRSLDILVPVAQTLKAEAIVTEAEANENQSLPQP